MQHPSIARIRELIRSLKYVVILSSFQLETNNGIIMHNKTFESALWHDRVKLIWNWYVKLK